MRIETNYEALKRQFIVDVKRMSLTVDTHVNLGAEEAWCYINNRISVKAHARACCFFATQAALADIYITEAGRIQTNNTDCHLVDGGCAVCKIDTRKGCVNIVKPFRKIYVQGHICEELDSCNVTVDFDVSENLLQYVWNYKRAVQRAETIVVDLWS